MIETNLNATISQLPADIYDGKASTIDFELEDEVAEAMAERPDDPKVREGSYFIGKAAALMQVVDGVFVPVEVRKGRQARADLHRARHRAASGTYHYFGA
jgi:N12 class adenine-specific DNA methylase